MPGWKNALPISGVSHAIRENLQGSKFYFSSGKILTLTIW